MFIPGSRRSTRYARNSRS